MATRSKARRTKARGSKYKRRRADLLDFITNLNPWDIWRPAWPEVKTPRVEWLAGTRDLSEVSVLGFGLILRGEPVADLRTPVAP